MKTEHTPTPENTGKHTPTFFLSNSGGYSERGYFENISDGQSTSYIYGLDRKDAQEKSQLIVTAVNSYSTLKAENERLKGDYDAVYSDLQAVRKVSRDRKKSIVTLQSDNEQKEKRIKDLEQALTRFVEFGQKHILESGDSYESAMFRQCKEALNPKQ